MRGNIDNVMARIDQIYKRIYEIQSLGRQGTLRKADQPGSAGTRKPEGPGSAGKPVGPEQAGSNQGAGEGKAFTTALEQALLQEAVQDSGSAGGESTFDGLIGAASEVFGVDSNLIKAVIQKESEFNPSAVSPKGALGLMQLMPETAELLGVDDPYNPAKNVYGGTKYLKQMIDRYEGNLEKALAAYNAGPTRVDRAGGVPDIEETKNYVEGVLGLLDEYRKR